MVHKQKKLRRYLIRTDAIVSSTDLRKVLKVGDEIFDAVAKVDTEHPTTKDFTFRNVHTATKELK